MDAASPELRRRRPGEVRGPRRLGIARRGHDRHAHGRQPDRDALRTMTRRIPIGIKTSPQRVDWATLDRTWARIGELDVFDSVWMNDHLTDIAEDRHGKSLEALTAMATLVHRVPGRWVGHAVLSATFRHPSVLAKSA